MATLVVVAVPVLLLAVLVCRCGAGRNLVGLPGGLGLVTKVIAPEPLPTCQLADCGDHVTSIWLPSTSLTPSEVVEGGLVHLHDK